MTNRHPIARYKLDPEIDGVNVQKTGFEQTYPGVGFIQSFIVHSLIHHSFTHTLILPCIHYSFTHSFMHSFTHSFMHSSVQ